MRYLPLTLLLATTACSMMPRLALPTPPVAEAYPAPSGPKPCPNGAACSATPGCKA